MDHSDEETEESEESEEIEEIEQVERINYSIEFFDHFFANTQEGLIPIAQKYQETLSKNEYTLVCLIRCELNDFILENLTRLNYKIYRFYYAIFQTVEDVYDYCNSTKVFYEFNCTAKLITNLKLDFVPLSKIKKKSKLILIDQNIVVQGKKEIKKRKNDSKIVKKMIADDSHESEEESEEEEIIVKYTQEDVLVPFGSRSIIRLVEDPNVNKRPERLFIKTKPSYNRGGRIFEKSGYNSWDNSYYFSDFKEEFMDKLFICDSTKLEDCKTKEDRDGYKAMYKKDLFAYILHQACRVIHLINCLSYDYFVKKSIDDPFHFKKDKGTFLIVDKSTFYIKYIEKNENGLISTDKKQYNIFKPCDNKKSIMSTDYGSEPYHISYPIKVPNKFNIFPGFVAFHIDFDKNVELHMQSLQKLFDHIKRVWCENDEKNFKAVITTLCEPIRTLERSNRCFCLVGSQGVGKTLVFDFLITYVYGMKISVAISGLSRLFSTKFNFILNEKLFILIDEASQAHMSYKEKHTNFQDFKNAITAKNVVIEKKYQEVYSTRNYITYNVISDNIDVISLEYENNNRRFDILQTNAPNETTEYYNELVESLNQSTGDIFYSFCLSKYYKDNFYTTEHIACINKSAQIIKDNDKPTPDFFIESIISEEICFDIHIFVKENIFGSPAYRKIIDDVAYLFISSQNLYEYFKVFYKKVEHSNYSISCRNFSTQFNRALKARFPSFGKSERYKNISGYFINQSMISTYDSRDTVFNNGFV